MTATSNVLSIVDAIAALITPPSGITLDASGSRPVIWLPDRIYVYPNRQIPKPEGDGSLDVTFFYVRLAWTVNGLAEESAGQTRLREVSLSLDAAAAYCIDQVRANRRNTGLWEALQVDAVTYDGVVTLDVRGIFVDISGYRMVGDGV